MNVPIQIQINVHTSLTSVAAAPCQEDNPRPGLAGAPPPSPSPCSILPGRIFPVPASRLQQEKYQASRLLQSRRVSIGNARTSINPRAPRSPALPSTSTSSRQGAAPQHDPRPTASPQPHRPSPPPHSLSPHSSASLRDGRQS